MSGKWLDEEVALLRQLVAEGKTHGEVRESFPTRSNGSIREKICDIKNKTEAVKFWTADRDATLIGLVQDGETCASIAASMGMDRRTISYRIKKLGLEANRPEARTHGGFWNAERVDQLLRLWEKGLSASKVAHIMHAPSRSAIIGKIHRIKPHYDIKPRLKNPISLPITQDNTAPRAPMEKRVVSFRPLSVGRSKAKECQFMTGDAPPYAVCNKETVKGYPYCAEHAAICYRQTKAG